MAQRVLTILRENGAKHIQLAAGACRLMGRRFDAATTLKLDKMGQRHLTDREFSKLRQNEIEFDISQPHLELESFERHDDVEFSDEAVSNLHAMLFNDEGRLWLSDLGSTNGTYVNGQQAGLRELMPGDVVTLGEVKLEVSE